MSPININFKLVKAVHGYNAVSEDIIRDSWDKTGLWPTDYRFVDLAQIAWDGQVNLLWT